MASTRPTSLRSAERRHRRWHHRLLAGSAVAALALGGSIAAATAATSHTTPQLQVITASPYTGVLGNANGFSLYVLSIEAAGKLHCTGACLKIWPPDLVKSSTKSVSVGKGVKGKVGFVKRSSTTKQVTFNGYPLYRYVGDKKAKQANGEGIVADGGTWTLVSAAATKSTTTPVKQKAFLTSVTSSPYTDVLATTRGVSLYVLSAESGGTLHCTGSCLSLAAARSRFQCDVGHARPGDLGQDRVRRQVVHDQAGDVQRLPCVHLRR